MIEERKKLEQDIREGKIFNGIPQMGRGRGAAMTLPAWMTEVLVTRLIHYRGLHQIKVHLHHNSLIKQNNITLMYSIHLFVHIKQHIHSRNRL